MKIRTSLVHLTAAVLDLRWNGAERISKCGWSIRTGPQCESRRGQPSEMLCAVARRVSGLPKLRRVPPLAYDLTGSACTSAANWRSSAHSGLLDLKGGRASPCHNRCALFWPDGSVARAIFDGVVRGEEDIFPGVRYVEASGHIRVHGASGRHVPSRQNSLSMGIT
jgi:hypothetical protein